MATDVAKIAIAPRKTREVIRASSDGRLGSTCIRFDSFPMYSYHVTRSCSICYFNTGSIGMTSKVSASGGFGERPPFDLPAFVHCPRKGDFPLYYSKQFRSDFRLLNGRERSVREGIATFSDAFATVSEGVKTHEIRHSENLRVLSLLGKKSTTVARGVHLIWERCNSGIRVLRILPESAIYSG